MDENVKVCPECGAEYYAHVAKCANCEVALVSPEQKNKLRQSPKAAGALVCIEEGDYDRISLIASALEKEGFAPQVLKMPKQGCGGGDFGVFVEQSMAREAVRRLDEIWDTLHPELREADERLAEGLCPACGTELKDPFGECPGCGLNLGGGGGACGDSSCGSGGAGSGCGH